MKNKQETGVGGFPQYFTSTFYLEADNNEQARKKAEEEMKKLPATFTEIKIEEYGHCYEIHSNSQIKFHGTTYPENTITHIRALRPTMTIVIDCVRNGKNDTDTFGLWCVPADFQEALNELLSKTTYHKS